jgi:hypothetical protein
VKIYRLQYYVSETCIDMRASQVMFALYLCLTFSSYAGDIRLSISSTSIGKKST